MKKINKRTAETEWTKGNKVYRMVDGEFIPMQNSISFGKSVLDSVGTGFYIAL